MPSVKVLASTALALAALTSCSSGSDTVAEDVTPFASSATPDTFDVAGEVQLPGGCGSTKNGYYPDIDAGAQVTVLNSASEPVALGRLTVGSDAPGGFGPCTYAFAVPKVPAGESDIFSLRIGSREPYQFTRSQASTLTLSLGN